MANESTNTPFISKLTGIWPAEDGEMDATSSVGNKSMALVMRTLNMDYTLEQSRNGNINTNIRNDSRGY